MIDYNSITEEELKAGGIRFERFWLRPKNYNNETAPLRIRINEKWGGWKVKDELISILDLEVGDTISTEVTPLLTSGIINDDDDTDFFASASAADWLLDNNVGVGTIIDCIVRFKYSKMPVGPKGKEVNVISLILEKGINVVGTDQEYIDNKISASAEFHNLIRDFL